VEVIGSNPIAPTIIQLILQTLPRRPCPQMSSWLISAHSFLREDHSYDAGMGRAFLFADRLSVNIHRGSHVGVPQQFLLHLHVHAKTRGAFAYYKNFDNASSRP
jgi:hypothetical protein